jgi:hypothetical protein
MSTVAILKSLAETTETIKKQQSKMIKRMTAPYSFSGTVTDRPDEIEAKSYTNYSKRTMAGFRNRDNLGFFTELGFR